MSAKRQQAVAFFVGQGWTVAQSAGIVANLEAESGLRPDAVGDGGAAYGIAQWHPPRQSTFAGLFGKPIQGSSLSEQLYFVHAELQGTEKAAGDKLAACTTAGEAGASVSVNYERPADKVGEADKRAMLAERIAQEYASAPIPPAPIPTPPATPKPPYTPDLPSQRPESAMPAILATLLPMVLGMFSPAGQAQLQPITSKPADQIAPFLMSLFSQIAGSTGVVPAGQPIKTDAEAVAAVAELQKLKTTNAALVADIEAKALGYLSDLAPLFDKLAQADAATNAALLAGRNAALERAIKDPYDVAPVMVKNVTQTSNWLLGGLAAATMAAMILKGLFPDLPDYVSMILPVLGLLAGQISKERGAIIGYRFDGTPASNSANAINAEVARAGQVATAAKRGVVG